MSVLPLATFSAPGVPLYGSGGGGGGATGPIGATGPAGATGPIGATGPSGGGGGGYTKSLIPLNTNAFPSPGFFANVTPGGGVQTLSLPFALVLDRYYRISIPSIFAVNEATSAGNKNEGVEVTLQYATGGGGSPSAWFGVIPWDTGAAMSFSLTFKAEDTSAVIKLVNNGTGNATVYWIGGNTNVMVLEDMGTIP